MLCGYCNELEETARNLFRRIEPPVMLCGYCNQDLQLLVFAYHGIEPPVMLCGYCNAYDEHTVNGFTID